MFATVNAQATVSPRGAARIRAGHPWIFRADVVQGPDRDARDGGPFLVAVVDGRGRGLARATWARDAKIALRVLSRADEGPGESEDVNPDDGSDLASLMKLVDRKSVV